MEIEGQAESGVDAVCPILRLAMLMGDGNDQDVLLDLPVNNHVREPM
jgi:hypothetical protein